MVDYTTEQLSSWVMRMQHAHTAGTSGTVRAPHTAGLIRIRKQGLGGALGCLLRAGIVLIVLVAMPLAFAAENESDPPKKMETVEVTGSYIKRAEIEGIAPVHTITREDIERSAKANAAEILRALPYNFMHSFDETFTRGVSTGGASLALHGLPQKYTLVLINGRRVASYGFAQGVQNTFVDLNSIPLSAIERIEVLQDGASALYGSDAVGGVVNIILRNNYRGVELGASIGTSYNHDVNEKKASLVAGRGDLAKNRYNIVASLDVMQRDMLSYTGRDYIGSQDFRDRPGGLLLWNQNGGTYRTNPRQPFATCPANQIRPLSDFNSTASGNVCAFNPAPYLTLFPATERYQGRIGGQVDISPRLSAFADLLVSHSRTSYQTGRLVTLNGTSTAFDPLTGGVRSISNVLPVGNPSNPFATPVGIQYAFSDVGHPNSTVDANFAHLSGGLRGKFGDWEGQAAVQHSEQRQTQTAFNQVNSFVLQQVIADGSYNFLDPATTPAVTDALRLTTRRKAVSTLDSMDVKASTTLLEMSHGPLAFATGMEWRREALTDTPDALQKGGYTINQSVLEVDGARSVMAAFAEFNVPLLKTLEANLAARYDHYSDFGSAVSPKAGFKWQPNSAFLLRGSIARGFRAATLPEIANSALTFASPVQDNNDPTQPGRDVTVVGITRNNPNLEAEKTRNINLGIVLSPARDTSIGLSYYRIGVDHAIGANESQFILDNPAQFPGQIIRNQNGELVSITDRYNSDFAYRTSGLDLDFSQAMRSKEMGKFTLSGRWTFVHDFRTQLGVGGPLVDIAGSNSYFGTPMPSMHGVTTLGWERGAWAAALTHTYIHSFRQDWLDQDSNPGLQSRIGSYQQLDLDLSYEGSKNLRWFGSIRNLSNARPPFDPAGGGFNVGLPYALTTYDARGRYFNLGLRYKFD